ncbi:MAG: M1 family peptidase, partial [Oligoflexus sp.]|nr:M1 family peptidase [Pseudopedobacter sp.]
MKNIITTIVFIGLFGSSLTSFAQLMKSKDKFTKADTLRGSNTSPYRTCYDIDYYHLDVKIDPKERFISGSNLFKFTATTNFKTLQFDLFDNLNVDKII